MSNLWPIHTIVFDLDDTLFAEAEYNESGFRAVSDWLRERHDVEGFEAAAVQLFRSGVRGRIFDLALQQLAVQATSQLVEALVDVYRSHTPQLSLLPDAAECLAWASGRFRLALLSDGYVKVQQAKFAALEIREHFASCVFTDALGREFWKPATEGFLRISSELKGASEGYLYIADNPRKDFLGPRSLGWRTIRIRRGSEEHASYEPTPAEAAELELKSLTELKSRIRPVQPSSGLI